MRTHMSAIAATFALAACAGTPPRPANAPAAAAPAARGTLAAAIANLAPASGTLVSGRLRLSAVAGGVHVGGDIGGLAPYSVHGFHIHATGDCSAVDASSAGGHFNPDGSVHGRPGAGPHHAGDIDNIVADAGGVAHVDANVAGVVLGGGGAHDIVGRAFIVHAAPDDHASQPSGNAGARVACGVIVPAG